MASILSGVDSLDLTDEQEAAGALLAETLMMVRSYITGGKRS